MMQVIPFAQNRHWQHSWLLAPSLAFYCQEQNKSATVLLSLYLPLYSQQLFSCLKRITHWHPVHLESPLKRIAVTVWRESFVTKRQLHPIKKKEKKNNSKTTDRKINKRKADILCSCVTTVKRNPCQFDVNKVSPRQWHACQLGD